MAQNQAKKAKEEVTLRANAQRGAAVSKRRTHDFGALNVHTNKVTAGNMSWKKAICAGLKCVWRRWRKHAIIEITAKQVVDKNLKPTPFKIDFLGVEKKKESRDRRSLFPFKKEKNKKVPLSYGQDSALLLP